MSVYYGRCEVCGNIIAPHETPCFPVTGWEVLRIGGGPNRILDRKRIPDRVRHLTCVKGTEKQERLAL